MVKNKATARLCCIFLVWSLSFFLSLSLADLALSRPVLRVSLSPTPFIPRVPLDPAGAGPRHMKLVSTVFEGREVWSPAPRPPMGGLAPRPQTWSPEPRLPLQLMEPLYNHCQNSPDHHQQASWPQLGKNTHLDSLPIAP